MDYYTCPELDSSFWLLLAPPAWGKTYRLIELMRMRPDVEFVFISPLRALANEFFQKCEGNFPTLLIESREDWKKLKAEHSLIITTPECFHVEYLKERKRVFVLDEFHLYFYWGTSFREKMWESLIDIFSLGNPVLGLSATLGPVEEEFFKLHLKNQVEHFIKLDYGNQRLKNFPHKHYYFSPILLKFLPVLIEEEIGRKEPGCVLLFVKRREEVHYFQQLFSKNGRKVLSCVGGEAKVFSEKLQKHPDPDLIVCTTVLSHGVNLPPIKCLIFNYSVENKDFWIQMVGRGGRKGESFRLFSMDPFLLKAWPKVFSLVTLALRLFFSSLLPWHEHTNQTGRHSP